MHKDLEVRITETFARLLAIRDKFEGLIGEIEECVKKKDEKKLEHLRGEIAKLREENDSNFNIIDVIREDFEVIFENYFLATKNMNIAQRCTERLNNVGKRILKTEIETSLEDVDSFKKELSLINSALEMRFKIKKVSTERENYIKLLEADLAKKNKEIEQIKSEFEKVKKVLNGSKEESKDGRV